MNLLKNVSVRAKLIICSLPLAIALVVSVVFMGIQINQTEADLTKVYYDILYNVNSNLVNADRDFYQAMVASMQYYDFKNGFTAAPPEFAASMLDGNWADFDENKQQVYDKVGKAINVAKGDNLLFKELKSADGKSFEQCAKEFEEGMAAWEASFDLKANTGDWEAWHGTFSTARDSINDMQEITEAWADKEKAELVKSYQMKIIVISAIFGVLILILAIIVVSVIKGIRKGIAAVTGDLDELAKGDLTKKYPGDDAIGNDDIGKITKSAKMLTAKLHEVMSTSRDMSQELSNTSADLAESSSQATMASGQVTQAVEDISKGAVSQAGSVESAVTNTDDIGKNIDVITDAVGEMDKNAEQMIEACEQAMNSLNSLVRQNEEVTMSVKEIGDTINSTNASAKSISQFTEAITDIASRTNLLSLNASIEAARAGEAGKGFAVVADEIRQLADQSNESAGEIRAIVEQLLSDSASSVIVLDKLNKSFTVQEEQLDSTRNTMMVMSDNVNSVKATSQDISQRVSGLNAARNSLTEIIADLSAISEENAASTQETNASMEELNATFSLISDSAVRLQKLAEDLASAISYFEVEVSDIQNQ